MSIEKHLLEASNFTIWAIVSASCPTTIKNEDPRMTELYRDMTHLDPDVGVSGTSRTSLNALQRVRSLLDPDFISQVQKVIATHSHPDGTFKIDKSKDTDEQYIAVIEDVGRQARQILLAKEGEKEITKRIIQTGQSPINPESVKRWANISNFKCTPYEITGKETLIISERIQKLSEDENILCTILLEDWDGGNFIMPVNITSGHYDKTTVDINLPVAEWISIPRKDIAHYTFYAFSEE